MKKISLYAASLIFGALLGIWLSGAATHSIIRANGQVTDDVVIIQESIRNGTLTQSTIISLPTGSYIEISGTWAASILIFILPILFLWAALTTQKETDNPTNINRTITTITILLAAFLSITAVFLSEYIRLINYASQNNSLLSYKSTDILDLARFIVTTETLLGGLFIFVASGTLPALTTLNNQTKNSQTTSATWWILTILLITYGLIANVSPTSLPQT